jgi:hypothetical protein
MGSIGADLDAATVVSRRVASGTMVVSLVLVQELRRMEDCILDLLSDRLVVLIGVDSS